MKIIVSSLIVISLFTSCVDKNGFDNFNFTPAQEQWENNQINSRINDDKELQGTVTAVYLNKVMPNLYKEGEYFYISLYLKDDSQEVSFTLNDQPSIYQEKLPNNDEFKKFTNSTNKWNKYYLVGFLEQKGVDTLSLEVKNDKVFSNKMAFKKDE
ncbi:hypothetical protein [Sulfurimonas microaerophilic]|uniref:hypothetical protein n=1 Tax=Sulfurimonas microaerophilic TaxID=3058392 RepID=UPI00271466A7|nr:hypothetical protein [Sulfurimonas sp. hsl 1-7]